MPSRISLVQSPSPSAFATLDRVAARTPDGHTLFDNLSLTFGRERTGVVGRNGAGKTTLLRLVAGEISPAAGSVARPGRIGWLRQRSDPRPGESLLDLLGAAPAMAVVRRVLAGDGDAGDLAAADWSLETRITTALAQVGLPDMDLDRAASTLSGGEQTRVRLAALLLDSPDLLVLDEPTNHLDADGRAAVATLLEGWKGGAVVVSHDRTLLRRMDRIVELSSLGAAVYGGGYDLYAERKAAEREAAERDLEVAERQASRIARENQKAVERKGRRDKAGRAFAAKRSEPKILLGAMAERAENSGARETVLAASRAARAEADLDAAREGVERVRAMTIPMPETGLSSGQTVAVLDRVEWVTPQGRRVLAPFSLRLTGPERVAVTGPNGAGKTTLLKLISGRLSPTQGRVERPVVAALLDQDMALLRDDETLLAAWSRLNPGGSRNQAQAALAKFLFRNAAAERVIGSLSGGERLRAALACVLMGDRPPRLLILDEPTNHLDLDSIVAVEAALSAYDGALVVVSHDPEFLAGVGVERVLELRPCG